MSTINYFKKYSIYALLIVGVLFAGCSKDDDAPEPENEPEIITDVKLIFTNSNDPNDVVTARAQDPDGPGVQELAILDTINLGVNKTYTLTYEIFNNLETPGENIGDEIKDEDDEHQFFFSFSNNAFANPTGNGNIDTASDPINYVDKDDKGQSLGFVTTWMTSATTLTNGTFTVRLQHQPGVKTATSGATDGDTDFNLPFVLNIK